MIRLFAITCFFSLFISHLAFSQIETKPQHNSDMNQTLPYKQIPESPSEFTASNAVARMVDGLGYRYYWGSESLREVDLAYKISEESRSSLETIEHIYGLSKTILNTVQMKPNIRGEERPEGYDALRAATLLNLEQSSQILKASSDEDLENYNIVFQRGDQSTSYPFWNLINGMVSDALWHTGQIVSYRRASGNPLHSGVSVLRGITRE